MTKGTVVRTLDCTDAGLSSAALAATMAAKSVRSLALPPTYAAGANCGSVTAQTIAGLASGLNSASDAAVTEAAPAAALLALAAEGCGGAVATLTTAPRWKNVATALLLTLGCRMDRTARYVSVVAGRNWKPTLPVKELKMPVRTHVCVCVWWRRVEGVT